MNTLNDIPLAFLIGGYSLVFLLPWRESSAAGTQTEWRRNE